MSKALEILVGLAYSGNEQAAYGLSKMYYYGNEVPEDLKKSEEFAETGLDCFDISDDMEMQMFIDFAEMYHYGANGVEKNMSKAVEWYEQIAFLSNNENIILTLAQIYVDGDGVPQNGKRAVELLTKIAFVDVPPEDMYSFGGTCPMEYGRYRYGFDYGSDKARYKLGCMYLYGNVVEKDIYKAAWWFSNLYEVYDYLDSDLVIEMAEKFHLGEGVAKNVDRAMNWYHNFLTYEENKDVMYLLGNIYFEINNIETAIEWYEKSAELENTKAMYRLAEIYEYGYGVEKNLFESLEWIDKISEILNQKIQSE